MTNTVSRTVSDETLNCIIHIESGGNPRAKASTSSALGLFQFLTGTWLATIKAHRPELLDVPHDKLLFMRTDPQLCIELGARFTEDNLAVIGHNATGGDLYLAHFLGAADARRLFRAPPDQPVEELVRPEVIAANRSIMQGKTVAQVRAWAARRMHEAAGRDWISRYYVPQAQEPAPEDFPDPQRPDPVPTPQPRPAPAPEPPPAPAPAAPDDGGFADWVKRWRGRIGTWIGTGAIGTLGLGQVTDWKILAVIVAGVVVSGGMVGLFYLISQRGK